MPGDLGDAALTASDLLNTVAIKLPPFCPDNIETWYVQLESQCCLKGVTASQTKFDYCMQSMFQEVTVKVLDLIRNLPSEDLYYHLKDRLLCMFALNN